MTYRVILDYGDVELTIMHKTNEHEEEQIMEEVIETLIKRGFGLPPEEFITVIESAPEWQEE